MKTILWIGVIIAMMVNAVDAAEPISEDAKALAIMSIKGYEHVIDASIYQGGWHVKLVLLVDYGTTQSHARRMSEHFIRLLKTYAPDTSPGDHIGPGRYDYHISVAMPSQTMLGKGVKLGVSHELKWLPGTQHFVRRSGKSAGPFF